MEPEARRQARGGDNPEHLGCTAGADGAAPYQGRGRRAESGLRRSRLKISSTQPLLRATTS
mgnify:CR=1 FL=1